MAIMCGDAPSLLYRDSGLPDMIMDRKKTVATDLIKIYFDFWNAFCVSVEFGSYAARNMFP